MDNTATERPKCEACVHRRDFPGRHGFAECVHPQVETLEIGAMAIGVIRGNFFWPREFDPIYLTQCSGFEPKAPAGRPPV